MIINQRHNGHYIVNRSLFLNNLKYFYASVSVGAFDWQILFWWILGKKCVRVWIGTDVLKCTKIWHYRWRAKLCALFSDQVTVAPWLTSSLMEWGIGAQTIQHTADLSYLKRLYPNGIEKNNRKSLNILFYQPYGHIRNIDVDWLYGFDIIGMLTDEPRFSITFCNGNIPIDRVFNRVDVLLRPVRHDGQSIMVQEARELGIPVIWSYETGQYREPNLDKIFSRLMDLWKQKNGNSL